MNTLSLSLSSARTRKRWILWLLLLAFTLSAVVWLDDSNSPDNASRTRRVPRESVKPPVEEKSDTESTTASRLARALERLELPSMTKGGQVDLSERPDLAGSQEPSADLFAARSWYVAPPPPPPVTPKAPPLPFKVIGRIIEGDAPAVFLANQGRNFVAREGVQLDDTYLVEHIEKDRMTFIYLPLAERQYLTLGAAN